MMSITFLDRSIALTALEVFALRLALESGTRAGREVVIWLVNAFVLVSLRDIMNVCVVVSFLPASMVD
jgi:hypothetical protein